MYLHAELMIHVVLLFGIYWFKSLFFCWHFFFDGFISRTSSLLTPIFFFTVCIYEFYKDISQAKKRISLKLNRNKASLKILGKDSLLFHWFHDNRYSWAHTIDFYLFLIHKTFKINELSCQASNYTCNCC